MTQRILYHPMSKAVCWYLALFLGGFLALPSLAAAAFLPSAAVDGSAVEAPSAGEEVLRALEEGILAERLADLGLSPEEAASRIGALTPEERQAVMADLDRLQVGGDGVGAVVGLAVLVLLVILIIKLLDKEIVIK